MRPMTQAAFMARRIEDCHERALEGWVQPAHEFLAAQVDEPSLHRQIVLPGAKSAVPADWLAQRGPHGAVAAINDAWRTQNPDAEGRLSAQRDRYRERLRAHQDMQKARAMALAELEREMLNRVREEQ